MVIGLFLWPCAYPALAAVVGETLPNYQGMFLRGQGSQAHTKNNGSTVGNTKTIHASGALGVVQGDTIRNISGSLNRIGTSGYDEDTATQVFARTYHAQDIGRRETMGHRKGDFLFDASRVVPTATENRPVNVAVNYLIKAY